MMSSMLKQLFETFASDLLDDICDELKESPMELCKCSNETNK